MFIPSKYLLLVILLYRSRIFENKELERISGLKETEVIAGWRKQQEKLHNFHCPPNTISVQIMEDKTQGTYSWHEGDKHKILIGKAERKILREMEVKQ
jgi:hypothetical protein